MGQMKREELSQYRQEIKDNKDLAGELTDRFSDIKEALFSEDPKSRKNAALLLGELSWKESEKGEVLKTLYEVYDKEVVLYVRSSYLKGMNGLKVSLPDSMSQNLEKRFHFLLEEEVPSEEKKHVKEELRWLMSLLDRGERAHSFKGIKKKVPLLLTVPKDHENYLLSELKRKGANPEDLRKTPFGIRVMTEDISPILSSRIYDKIYFIVPIHRGSKLLLSNMEETIGESMLSHMLSMYLEGDGPIPFRVSVKLTKADKDASHKAAEEFTNTLERLFPGKLFNAPGNYEIEFLFAQRMDESFGMYLWFKDFKNNRFAYRNTKVATSMAPTKAATMLEMAYPYLQEGGFCLDPFCGTGTLLIERQKLKKPKETFGTDIYGTAITEAREASKVEKEDINFINRDYFDFTFDGDFNEIITEFPDLFHKEKPEKEKFLKQFFAASIALTKKGARIIILTNENGSIKQQVKRIREIRFIREIPFGGRRSLFIIERN
ncbi:MAG: methyltransferase [Lachnospiraceae bacterium]|nr:methyltransferase [Lachnospiraceae bacterium]